VAVSFDDAILVKLLGSGIVGLLGVGEETGAQVQDVQGSVEGNVGGDGVAVLRVAELARNHFVDGRDQTHGRLVAGSRGDLETVGERELVKGEGTVVDVVAGTSLERTVSKNKG
jgi:hypothetical protein